MKKFACLSFILVGLGVLAAGAAWAQETDAEGTKDHPLLSRMPGYYISRAENKDFDAHSFWIDGDKQVDVEGKSTHIFYVLQPNAKEPSRLEILRQYENAIKKIGGNVLVHDHDGSSYMKLTQAGKEIWVHVDAYITSQYNLWIIEKAGMEQQVVADAAAFSNDIRTTGHAAVYGIYFDSGKSAIKPESEPALAEIAKLLKNDAALKLNVVGHTDNDGTLETNMKLSEARAAAVVQALVAKYGISSARLKAFGVGPLAPVASNDTPDGKAKNRRVELVKL
jgi:outer membrane protein OmpA-like peptidoglycan-associated protein